MGALMLVKFLEIQSVEVGRKEDPANVLRAAMCASQPV
jgi:hypothetical protein